MINTLFSWIRELLEDFFQRFFPNAAYKVWAGLLLLIIAILLVLLLMSFSQAWKDKWKDRRANLVLAVLISALLLMTLVVGAAFRWQWIVGLLPMLLVGYQIFFLWLYAPKESDSNQENRSGAMSFVPKESYDRARQAMNSHFGLKTLFVRYGLPAVLLGIAGIVFVDVLVDPEHFFSLWMKITGEEPVKHPNISQILLVVRLGAAGAYVYVLLELGRRTFRHDVTGASAMWCLVTMVLGPVLAGTVAVLWRMEGPSDGWWGTGVVLFFAGFAPRRVIAAIEQAAVQLLKIGSTAGVVVSRQTPLNNIRGISAQIEERLSEEGILDVNSLSTAEPVRLVRNTSFDLRQILAWIDEAILIVAVPKSWQTCEEEGIRGAIDLVWYYKHLPAGSPPGFQKDLLEIVDLATKGGKIDPANLVSTMQRLSEDAQVQYVGALYSFTEYSGGTTGTGDGGPDRGAKGTGASNADSSPPER